MKWLVSGYYGLGNIGDELMCRHIVDWICEIDRNASVGVMMARGGERSRLWLPEHVKVIRADRGKFLTFRKLMRGVDVFIVGGGTCFHRHGVCGLYQNLAAKSLGAKVVWLAIGADQLGGLKNQIAGRMSLACVNAVSVRDRESSEQLAKLRPSLAPLVSPDLVFSLSDLAIWPECDPPPKASSALVVAWRDLSLYLGCHSEELLCETISLALVKAMQALGLSRIAILNTADAIDSTACELLYEQLRLILPEADLLMVDDASLPEKMSWLRNAGAVISARLHPLMLATFAKRPTFGISYASKMQRFSGLFEGELVAPVEDWLMSPAATYDLMMHALQTPIEPREPFEDIAGRVNAHRQLLEAYLD